MISRGLAAGLAALLLSSCATPAPLPDVSLEFFVPASSSNPWSPKIRNWQARHRRDAGLQGEPQRPSALAEEYDTFAAAQRHRLVEETVRWIQERSRAHYRPDGDRDHWATYAEVLDAGSDDCDGLDLLTFVLLRRFGFAKDEIFRAIVVQGQTGQHHMVTLWFDAPGRRDPWLLDPTGVVSQGLVRLSEAEGWRPIELFDEEAHYRVEPSRLSGAVSTR